MKSYAIVGNCFAARLQASFSEVSEKYSYNLLLHGKIVLMKIF